MRFIFGRRDLKNREIREESCYLMTNGLGGFSSMTITGSCSRNDHAVLMSCQREEAPNHRYNMIHCLEETIKVGDWSFSLSSQAFADDMSRECSSYLTGFVYEDYPKWSYLAEGVELTKSIVLQPDSNTVGISYELQNRSGRSVSLKVTPWMQFVPKGEPLTENQEFIIEGDLIILTSNEPDISTFSHTWRMPRGSNTLQHVSDLRPHQLGAEQLTDEKLKNDSNVATGIIESRGRRLYCSTNGRLVQLPVGYRTGLYYTKDACDGRPAEGCCAVNHCVIFEAAPGETLTGNLIYSTDGPVQVEFSQIREELVERRRQLTAQAGFCDDTARALVLAADQFVVYRASTGKQTILAGYPFFEDWGRDTMIALTGCCLSTGQYERARSILRTFMGYCRKGLMPNLFPEGDNEPRYNTADAALLFILAVYGYYRRTGDRNFAAECWPVMEEIIRWYVKGTDFCIGMDEDGLIRAGEGFDQVTWMDVRIGDILPTPRHGKPVEINAYWYNALRIMEVVRDDLRELRSGEQSDDRKITERLCHGKEAEELDCGRMAEELDCGKTDEQVDCDKIAEQLDYGKMAEQVQRSFQAKFWNEEAGCLKDVISGTEADCQIRCNQIWAVGQPFSVLNPDQERQVVETVFRRLYTPLGLRTLDPADPQFKPTYGGELLKRDLAYHQGTVWTYPLGAYYLAWLKVNGSSPWAVTQVRRQLESTTAALREGCIGQLPEIYDGLDPAVSRGCFAQAWSVGELLRVYEALECIEAGKEWYL